MPTRGRRFASADDSRSMPLVAFAFGSAQRLEGAAGALVRSEALAEGHALFVRPSVDVRFRLGGAAVEATAADPLLPAGAVVLHPLTPGDTHAAFLPVDPADAATVDLWLAARFKES